MAIEPEIAVDPHDLRSLREDITSIKGWIEHWRADAAHRLPCTPGSLDSAEFYASHALRALDRIERDAAPARAA